MHKSAPNLAHPLTRQQLCVGGREKRQHTGQSSKTTRGPAAMLTAAEPTPVAKRLRPRGAESPTVRE